MAAKAGLKRRKGALSLDSRHLLGTGRAHSGRRRRRRRKARCVR